MSEKTLLIVATVSYGDEALHFGMPVERRSAIIEIPADKVPRIVQQYFENMEWAREKAGRSSCSTLSFSILEEQP